MKMNRLTYLPILIGCVVTGLLPLSCTPAPRKEKETLIVKDLSGTRLWEDVSPSGIPFSETKGFTDRKAYHLEEGFVAWKFPGGTTIQHHMISGSMDYVGGKLKSMNSHGEMMPLEEVMVLARRLLELMGEPTDDLKEWAATEGDKGTYSFGAHNCNPVIYCEIRGSGGHIAPWRLNLGASWFPEKEMKKPLPLPFTNAGLVNLDPPSGNRYTLEEDFRLYQEKHGYPLSREGRLWASAALVIAAVIIYLWQRKKRRHFHKETTGQGSNPK